MYASSRKKTKEITIFLRNNSISSDYYHGGLDMEIRNQKQEKWTNGQIRVMVATNAFGMGIDKDDVRVVVHMNTPTSLEAYFQEAGRAGREGKLAYAILNGICHCTLFVFFWCKNTEIDGGSTPTMFL